MGRSYSGKVHDGGRVHELAAIGPLEARPRKKKDASGFIGIGVQRDHRVRELRRKDGRCGSVIVLKVGRSTVRLIRTMVFGSDQRSQRRATTSKRMSIME